MHKDGKWAKNQYLIDKKKCMNGIFSHRGYWHHGLDDLLKDLL